MFASPDHRPCHVHPVAASLLFADADASAALDRMVAAHEALTGVPLVEGDPERLIFQTVAYEIARADVVVGDAASRGLLQYATGGALDAVAFLYGVERLDGETDDALRVRARATLATLGAAGTPESWRAHALAASAEVASVNAYAPAGGDGLVRVVVAGAGGADLSDAALAAVDARLQADDVRQLCATVEVVRPTPVELDLDVVYHVRSSYRTASQDIVVAVAAAAQLYAAYLSATPGTDVVHDEVTTRLMNAHPGVRRVEVLAPGELVVQPDEVVRVSNVSVRLGAVEDA